MFMGLMIGLTVGMASAFIVYMELSNQICDLADMYHHAQESAWDWKIKHDNLLGGN